MLCGLGNLILPTVFAESFSRGILAEMVLMCVLGLLAAQFGAIGVWFGLGAYQFKWRSIFTLLLSLALSCVYVVGLKILDGGIPVWAIAVVVGIGVGGTLLTGAILLGLRWLSGMHIVDLHASSDDNQAEASRFSIGYLIGLTAAAAISIAIVKLVFRGDDGQLPPARELIEVLLMITQGAIICLIAQVCLLMSIASRRHNFVGLGLLPFILFLAIPANLLAIHLLYPTLNVELDFVLNYFSFMFGFMGLSALFSVLLALVGYRLLWNPPFANHWDTVGSIHRQPSSLP